MGTKETALTTLLCLCHCLALVAEATVKVDDEYEKIKFVYPYVPINRCKILQQPPSKIADGCIVAQKTDHSVLISEEGLILPFEKTGVAHVPPGAEFVVACPGGRNKLRIGDSTAAKGICLPSGCVEVDGEEHEASNLGCENRVTPEAKDTGRRCGSGPRTRLFNLGYTVEDAWYGLVQVCHDLDKASTLHSEHILVGSVLPDKRPSFPRPSFLTGGGELYESFSPSATYTSSAVLASLTRLLGSADLASELLNKTSLSRGHLAPAGDFVLNTHQHATFFYANTAPQWQSFNGGNWLSVETRVRNYASQTAANLSIITGTFGILTLPDERDIPREIFLGPEGSRMLPVPKYFWKIVHNPRTREGIVFVGINNPFISKVLLDDILCPNVCNGSGWAPRRGKWRRLSKGYVFCCEVGAFYKAVKNLPPLDVTSLLKGSRALNR